MKKLIGDKPFFGDIHRYYIRQKFNDDVNLSNDRIVAKTRKLQAANEQLRSETLNCFNQVVKTRTLVHPQLYNTKMIDSETFLVREVPAEDLLGLTSLNVLLNRD